MLCHRRRPCANIDNIELVYGTVFCGCVVTWAGMPSKHGTMTHAVLMMVHSLQR